jgi:hypothetical protein
MFLKGKKKDDSSERRFYRRIDFKEIIGIKIYDKEKVIQTSDFGGLSKNLSKSGILFESKNRFPLHTFVQIDLDVSTSPNVKMVSIIGEIIRIEEIEKDAKYEYGICFVKVPRKDEAPLEDFIAAYDGIKKGAGFMDRKRTFLFHFFSSTGMSSGDRERGWFRIPKVGKRKILDDRE